MIFRMIKVFTAAGKCVAVLLSEQEPVHLCAGLYFKVVLPDGKYFLFDSERYKYKSESWVDSL